MGALLGFIASLFAAIPGFISALYWEFATAFARKYSVATASVLAVVATLTTLIACFKTIVSSLLALAVVPVWLVTPLGLIIPGNFLQCISYICTAKICKTVYEVLNDQIRLVNNAN